MQSTAVHWRIAIRGGDDVGKLRRSRARATAGLGDDVMMCTLPHTAVSCRLQAGDDAWEVAGWAGTAIETLDAVYDHHSPDWQAGIGRRHSISRSDTRISDFA